MSSEQNGNTYIPGPTGPAIRSSENVPGSQITTSTSTSPSSSTSEKPIILKFEK